MWVFVQSGRVLESLHISEICLVCFVPSPPFVSAVSKAVCVCLQLGRLHPVHGSAYV